MKHIKTFEKFDDPYGYSDQIIEFCDKNKITEIDLSNDNLLADNNVQITNVKVVELDGFSDEYRKKVIKLYHNMSDPKLDFGEKIIIISDSDGFWKKLYNFLVN